MVVYAISKVLSLGVFAGASFFITGLENVAWLHFLVMILFEFMITYQFMKFSLKRGQQMKVESRG